MSKYSIGLADAMMRRFLQLIEIDRLMCLILENRMDFIRKKLLPMIQQTIATARSNGMLDAMLGPEGRQLESETDVTLAGKVIEIIANADPSPQKANTQWMVQRFVRDKLKLEDLPRVSGYLTIFERVKPRLPVELRDLNRYPTPIDLFNAIEPYQERRSQRQLDRTLDAQMHEQADIIYNGPDYKIVVPLTKEASCYFGMNTEWCTAATSSHNFFDAYNSRGRLYIILDKANNRRWQFHAQDDQFMDERDHPVDRTAFLREHPKVAEIFARTDGEPVAYISPVAQGQSLPVFKSSNGYVVKNRPGMFGKIMMTIETAAAPHPRPQISGRSVQNFDSAAIVKLLNELKVEGDPNGPPLLQEIYFRRNRWGLLADVGRTFLKFPDGRRWMVVSYASNYDFALIDVPFGASDRKVLSEVSIARDGSTDVSFIGQPKQASELGPYIVDLLLRTPMAKSWPQPIDLDEADAKRLLAKRPELCSLPVVYQAQGNSPLTRSKIVEALDEQGMEPRQPATWIDDKELIVDQWEDIHECVEDIGNDVAKWIAKLDRGDEHIEIYDAHLDDYEARDMLKSLKPEELRQVGEWLAEKYSDEVAELFDEEEYDPNDIDHIRQLQDEVEDADLHTAMEHAKLSGLERGAENEAVKELHGAIENNPYLYFVNGDGSYKRKMDWDTKVVMAVPVAELMKVIENGGSDYWKNMLEDAEIKADEPYNGWADYDEETAQEYFHENLYDAGILKSR